MTLTPQEVFSIMTADASWCGVDVRSEGEFQEGHWSGFKNTPILSNEHRHLVGTTYKQQGQEAAIQLGLDLVTPKRSDLVEQWANDLQSVDESRRFITCWRGGLRSKFSQNWLDEAAVKISRVQGGVKALRNFSLGVLAEGPKKIILLGGMTGNGKTELLRELSPAQVIDLEALAHHRGSAFGGWIKTEQPSQTTFENDLAVEVFKKPNTVIMEAESRLIGRCLIPKAFRDKMEQAEIVILESSMEERVERLYKEYVIDPIAVHGEVAVRVDLQNKLINIKRKLGGLQFSNILQKMHDRQHKDWIHDLLVHYYDKTYEYASKKHKRTILFRGDRAQVKEFFSFYRNSCENPQSQAQ